MKITEYEWEDIGIVHPDYFQGRGVSCTEWDKVYLGIGYDTRSALRDAIENVATSGCNVKIIKLPRFKNIIVRKGQDGCYYHVALYIKEEE